MFFTGYLNDLWMYNMTTGWWVWLSGGSGVNQRGIYGTKGQTLAGNIPGARNGHSMVFDSLARTIYVFGGYGCDSAGDLAGMLPATPVNIKSSI